MSFSLKRFRFIKDRERLYRFSQLDRGEDRIAEGGRLRGRVVGMQMLGFEGTDHEDCSEDNFQVIKKVFRYLVLE